MSFPFDPRSTIRNPQWKDWLRRGKWLLAILAKLGNKSSAASWKKSWGKVSGRRKGTAPVPSGPPTRSGGEGNPSASFGRAILVVLVLLLLFWVAYAVYVRRHPPVVIGDGDYLFCFWNTENFFDDQINGWKNDPDKDFDRWFARDPAAFAQKVKNLTEVLAALNNGKGPDILALAEVEAESRSAEALAESLNRTISEGTPPYKPILKMNPHGGRNIVTAIITRLPVLGYRTQLVGRRLRILEGHIEVGGRELAVLATHWTSRISDERGEGRAKYADQIYGRFRAMYKANPNVSLLVCGDFNDNPDDLSVTDHLHATGDLARVQAAGNPPLLYDVFANLWAENKGGKEVGTHFYKGRAYIFDQIVVSPGMLNGKGGWQCQTETAQIVKHRFRDRKGRPYHFTTARDRLPTNTRGTSDHLPVTVRLNLAPKN
jgi:endonuclease/exonuclease/phosphatase family metal-dependent hydrolase